ncbi:hypothetical protein GCM10027568_27140 [Humibacter soli]
MRSSRQSRARFETLTPYRGLRSSRQAARVSKPTANGRAGFETRGFAALLNQRAALRFAVLLNQKGAHRSAALLNLRGAHRSAALLNQRETLPQPKKGEPNRRSSRVMKDRYPINAAWRTLNTRRDDGRLHDG